MEEMIDQKLLQMEMKMQRKIDCLQSEVDAMKGSGRLSRVDELEKRCKHLEVKCTSMATSLRMLVGRWEFSEPDIPDNHWADQGFEEDYVAEVGVFVENIKSAISKMKSGKVSIINLGDRIEENVIFHDDALLPHWQNLADAINLCGHDIAGVCLAISDIQLSPQVLSILNPCLKRTTTLGEIELNRNVFDQARDGLAFAVDVAKSNPDMDYFAWCHNPIETFDDMQPCLEEIEKHPLISGVLFKSCFDGDVGYRVLCSLLDGNKNYESIELERNNIRTMGGTHLSDYIATNPPLQKLLLDSNRLDDTDATLIADALRRNTNLRDLQLDGNEITEIGRSALRNVIYDKTSLNSVADSNHICDITGIDCDFNEYRFRRSTGTSVSDSERRRAKIYNLLASRNKGETNVHHLNMEIDDNSLKLVPRVLEIVHNYAEDRALFGTVCHPLSIMHELLRGWKMPSLYENGRMQAAAE